MLVFRLVFSIAFGIVLIYRNILNQGKYKKEAPVSGSAKQIVKGIAPRPHQNIWICDTSKKEMGARAQSSLRDPVQASLIVNIFLRKHGHTLSRKHNLIIDIEHSWRGCSTYTYSTTHLRPLDPLHLGQAQFVYGDTD